MSKKREEERFPWMSPEHDPWPFHATMTFASPPPKQARAKVKAKRPVAKQVPEKPTRHSQRKVSSQKAARQPPCDVKRHRSQQQPVVAQPLVPVLAEAQPHMLQQTQNQAQAHVQEAQRAGLPDITLIYPPQAPSPVRPLPLHCMVSPGSAWSPLEAPIRLSPDDYTSADDMSQNFFSPGTVVIPTPGQMGVPMPSPPSPLISPGPLSRGGPQLLGHMLDSPTAQGRALAHARIQAQPHHHQTHGGHSFHSPPRRRRGSLAEISPASRAGFVGFSFSVKGRSPLAPNKPSGAAGASPAAAGSGASTDPRSARGGSTQSLSVLASAAEEAQAVAEADAGVAQQAHQTGQGQQAQAQRTGTEARPASAGPLPGAATQLASVRRPDQLSGSRQHLTLGQPTLQLPSASGAQESGSWFSPMAPPLATPVPPPPSLGPGPGPQGQAPSLSSPSRPFAARPLGPGLPAFGQVHWDAQAQAPASPVGVRLRPPTHLFSPSQFLVQDYNPQAAFAAAAAAGPGAATHQASGLAETAPLPVPAPVPEPAPAPAPAPGTSRLEDVFFGA